MLTYLHSNRPALLLLAFLLAVLLGGAAAVSAGDVVWSTGASGVDAWLWGSLAGRWALFAVLLSAQAYFFCRAVNLGEVFGKPLPLSAVVWVAVVGAGQARFPDPTLGIALICWSLSLMQIVQIFRQQRVLGQVFQAAFWTGLAVVICPAVVPLAGAVVLTLAYSRNFAWDEWTVLLVGLFMPLYIYAAGAFVWQGAIATPDWSWSATLGLGNWDLSSGLWMGLMLVGLAGLLLFLTSYGDASNRSRNSKNQLLFGCVALVASWLFMDVDRPWVHLRMWAFLWLPALPMALQGGSRGKNILGVVTVALLVANVIWTLWDLCA